MFSTAPDQTFKADIAGWENLLLEVDREYVFRFPKYRETEKRLRHEIAFLPLLRRHWTKPLAAQIAGFLKEPHTIRFRVSTQGHPKVPGWSKTIVECPETGVVR